MLACGMGDRGMGRKKIAKFNISFFLSFFFFWFDISYFFSLNLVPRK